MRTLTRSAVVIAGGKGSRLVNEGINIPKLLLEIQELSVLERIVQVLSFAGVNHLFFVLGHGSQEIAEEIERLQLLYSFDGNIFIESEPLGTAGHLMQILDKIPDEFLITFGDLFLHLDLNHYFHYFEEMRQLSGLVLTRSSEHPEDSNLVEVDESGFITDISFKGQHPDLEKRIRAITGIFFLRKAFLNERKSELGERVNLDLEKDILNLPKGSRHLVKAVPLKGTVRDIGTIQRLRGLQNLPTNYFDSVSSFHKYAFLDRDGVIIKDIVHRIDTNDLEISKDTIKGMKILRNHGYRFVVITNQPVIARGEATFKDIERIHGRIDRILLKDGLVIDEYYVCPHHPESGFKNENSKYKVVCDCRKPSTGLIHRAFIEIGLQKSYVFFIGDSWRDAEAARNYNLPFYATSHYQDDGNGCLSFEELAKRIVTEKQKANDYL